MSESRLRETITRIRPLDARAEALARARQDTLTKPRGSLGRLEALAVQLAGVTADPLPRVERKVIVTMAGDHGVAAEGVSAYPPEVTAQMVQNFLRGGAAINVIARLVGARVVVVDMGVAAELAPHSGLVHKKVAHGTANIACGPAMTREQALSSVVAGIDVVETELENGLDIVCTGDMGIGNTTPSSAIAAVFTGRPAAEVVGRGTGLDDAGLARKVATVERALAVNRPNPADGIDTLAKVGGFEIGGLAGVILGAAAHRRPVILDGFVSGAAAIIAVSLAPQVQPYLIAGHRSQEPGHSLMLDWLGVKPLLDLDMRLGEGTGGALGLFLAEAASKVLREMATFREAAVSDREAR